MKKSKWIKNIGLYTFLLMLLACSSSDDVTTANNVKPETRYQQTQVIQKSKNIGLATAKTPAEIGREIFNTLGGINKLPFSEYAKKFMSYDDIFELRDSSFLNLNEREKQQILLFKIPEETYKAGLKNEYTSLRKALQDVNVNPEKITFQEFVFQEDKNSKPILVKGVLIFVYQNKKYGVNSLALKDSVNSYRLISMGPNLLQ